MRHACVHQRQGAAADGRHRGGAVGGEDFADHAYHVGEVGLGGEHRHQRTLGQRAVADIAA